MKKIIFLLLFSFLIGLSSEARALSGRTGEGWTSRRATDADSLLLVNPDTWLGKDQDGQPVMADSVLRKISKRYNSFRIAIDGAWALNLDDVYNVNPIVNSRYRDKLERGYALRASAQRFWGKYFGLGLVYSIYRTSHESDHVNVPDAPYGYAEDDISMHFGGATLNLRFPSCKNNAFHLEAGMGYLGYRNKGVLKTQDIHVSVNTAAWILSVGYDLGFSKNVALGVQCSVIGGTVKKVKYSSEDSLETKDFKDSPGVIGHLDISVGLRFQINK